MSVAYSPLDELRAPEWTLEQALALPARTSHRVELVDGMLLMSPNPALPHQRASRRLASRLEAAQADAGAPFEVLEAINVIAPCGLLIPDIVVADEAAAAEAGVSLAAEHVVMVVEIASTNRSTDTVLKPKLYADAGVRWYWRVELEPTPRLTMTELDRGHYETRCVVDAGDVARAEHPFPVKIDPADLVRARS
ncbi:Uma2 family endonuclease [Yinghuangia seranimata]|uniref:Uma2 family endonuclease n=1 Tax=Yinghuangia seranimata TaxID=408067 RepID=UPI00248B9873|nr:Uma2 family endonuclease [Yinghuangia seranimata]MDI2131823.1 Uma2 family endonuclease [Yinghuangia seranimata]